MTLIPAEPQVPETQRANGPVLVRYDDISQSGHMLISAMPFAIGQICWPAVFRHPASKSFRTSRIIPILSRFVLESGAAPLSVSSNIECETRFHFAHCASPEGKVERIVLNMWCRVYGNAGRTHGPPPSNAGERLLAGQVFAEHVFTRPFDPPETRRVLELDVPGIPSIPPDRYDWQAPETLADLPLGGRWLDEAPTLDPAPIVFGTDHTDSNMHVNSLVYPRLFIDASLRKLWDQGKRMALRTDAMVIAFRKPSFAGDRVRISLRAFTCGDRVGTSVLLVSEKEAEGSLDAARPRCLARLWFVAE